MKPTIYIHYDFSDGSELDYYTALHIEQFVTNSKTIEATFSTHCLDFFTTERDAIIIKNNGNYISVNELLSCNKLITDKEIKMEHNILKIFKDGGFKWLPKK